MALRGSSSRKITRRGTLRVSGQRAAFFPAMQRSATNSPAPDDRASRGDGEERGVAGSRDTRVRRSERDWAAIIRRYEASGLGSRAFCRREGLAASSFQRWRQRLRGRRTARRRAHFVELVPPQTLPSAVTRTSSSGWSLELEFPGGVVVRWRG